MLNLRNALLGKRWRIVHGYLVRWMLGTERLTACEWQAGIQRLETGIDLTAEIHSARSPDV